MTRLSHDARKLVQALRNDRLSDDERARLRARVLAGTLAAAGAAGGASAATATTVASAAVAKGKVAAATAGTLAAGSTTLGAKLAAVGLGIKLSALGVVVLAAAPLVYSAASAPVRDEPGLDSKAAEHARVLEAPRAPAPAMVSVRALPVPPADVAVVDPPAQAGSLVPRVLPATRERPVPRASLIARVSAEPDSSSTIAAESALIERALAALRDDDLASAEQALARHALLYPQGALAPERERLRLRNELDGSSRIHQATERNDP